MKILIVDDDDVKIEAVRQTILESGIDPSVLEVAKSVLDAKKFLNQTTFALMILDILIPLRTGEDPHEEAAVDLLSELADSDLLKKPSTIVGLTAYDGLQTKAQPAFQESLWTVLHYDQTSDAWAHSIQGCISYLQALEIQKKQIDYETDLCIITALSSEAEAVRRLEWGWQPDEPLDESTWITRGVFSSNSKVHSAVLVTASRMGMVASSILATKIIALLRPRFLVMPGICAGIQPPCNIGDVIIADPTWDYQSGKRVKVSGETDFLIEPNQLGLPRFLSSSLDHLSRNSTFFDDLHRKWPAEKPETKITLRRGALATGSAVIADGKVASEIKQRQHRRLLGIEMEAYGVYAAAREASHPQPTAFALKAVCDYADVAKNDEFQKYAMYVSAETMRHFFETYMPDIRDHAGRS